MNEIMTMHSSKGLESDIVFVYSEKEFKLNNKSNQNLLYVASTRAKEKLYIFSKIG